MRRQNSASIPPVSPPPEASEAQSSLSRSLSRFDLLVIGIAQIIGAGIFVIAGVGVQIAGPGIILSFILAGAAAMLAALCYGELAAMHPRAGGAYSYAYAIFGEVVAWIIGWDLILEYGMAAGAVAVGWSHYLAELLRQLGHTLPPSLSPGEACVFNLPAFAMVLFLSGLLVFRTRMNALVARGLVFLKLGILAFIIVVGAFYVRPENWTPLLPFGGHSIIQGAAVVFFAYLGFDVVAITAEEAREPQRDVPFGIIGSLTVCTLLYLAAAGVLLGLAPYTQINPGSPFSTVFRQLHLPWAALLVSVGALGGITSVLYMLLLAQPRVLFAMGRDGLLPAWTAAVHPRYRTPHLTTLFCGLFVATLSALAPIDQLAFLCNIGTLFAFCIVCLGVFILRLTRPEAPRPFRLPAGKTLSLTGTLASLALMLSMPAGSWLRLAGWLALGLIIYFGYGALRGRWRPSN